METDKSLDKQLNKIIDDEYRAGVQLSVQAHPEFTNVSGWRFNDPGKTAFFVIKDKSIERVHPTSDPAMLEYLKERVKGVLYN